MTGRETARAEAARMKLWVRWMTDLDHPENPHSKGYYSRLRRAYRTVGIWWALRAHAAWRQLAAAVGAKAALEAEAFRGLPARGAWAPRGAWTPKGPRARTALAARRGRAPRGPSRGAGGGGPGRPYARGPAEGPVSATALETTWAVRHARAWQAWWAARAASEGASRASSDAGASLGPGALGARRPRGRPKEDEVRVTRPDLAALEAMYGWLPGAPRGPKAPTALTAQTALTGPKEPGAEVLEAIVAALQPPVASEGARRTARFGASMTVGRATVTVALLEAMGAEPRPGLAPGGPGGPSPGGPRGPRGR